MPDLTLQRKTAILVDGLPSAPDAPQGVLRFTGRRISGPGHPGHALSRRGGGWRTSGSRKRSSARDELE